MFIYVYRYEEVTSDAEAGSGDDSDDEVCNSNI